MAEVTHPMPGTRLAVAPRLAPSRRTWQEHEDVSLVQFQAICREQAFANLQDLDVLELNGVP